MLGILQQQADDVGVDRVDRRVEHQIEHLLDRQRGRDRLADLVDRERVLEPDVLVLQPLAIEAALHDVNDLLHLERLEDVVVGPLLHRLDRRLDGAEAGHDDRDDRDALLADLLDQLEPTHVGHLQIRDDQVVAALVQLLEGQRAVLDGVDDVPLHGQEVGQDLADHLLVVDDQDPGRLQHRDVVRPLGPVGRIGRVRWVGWWLLRRRCLGRRGVRHQGFSLAGAQELPGKEPSPGGLRRLGESPSRPFHLALRHPFILDCCVEISFHFASRSWVDFCSESAFFLADCQSSFLSFH